jgi:predicted transcriptional regulator
MKTLKLSKLESIDHIVTPDDFQEITLESPALCIFTDFKKVRPLVIDSTTKATDAQLIMEKSHVNLKLVLSKEKRICGVINSDNVSNQNIIKLVSLGEDRNSLTVGDLMQPRAELLALDFEELSNARVADVLKALEKNGLQHCLVVEHKAHEIRGLISSSDIARKLRIAINLSVAPSFSDIFLAIHQ